MDSHNGPPNPQNYITVGTCIQYQNYSSNNYGVHSHPLSTSKTLASRALNIHYSELPSSEGNFSNSHHRVSLKTQHKITKHLNDLPPEPDPLTSGGAPRGTPGSDDYVTNLYFRNVPINPSVSMNSGSLIGTRGHTSNDPVLNTHYKSMSPNISNATPGVLYNEKPQIPPPPFSFR